MCESESESERGTHHFPGVPKEVVLEEEDDDTDIKQIITEMTTPLRTLLSPIKSASSACSLQRITTQPIQQYFTKNYTELGRKKPRVSHLSKNWCYDRVY